MIHWYNNTFSLFIKNKFYGIQTFKISCLLDAPKIKRQSTPDNARAGRLTWWGFGWTRWWSSRSVCPSLCPSVRWSCSRLSVRSYGVHPCQTLPFYQLPVLIYNTDLPYCVCVTKFCSTWIHAQACVKAVNQAWKPFKKWGHFFYRLRGLCVWLYSSSWRLMTHKFAKAGIPLVI